MGNDFYMFKSAGIISTQRHITHIYIQVFYTRGMMGTHCIYNGGGVSLFFKGRAHSVSLLPGRDDRNVPLSDLSSSMPMLPVGSQTPRDFALQLVLLTGHQS